MDADEANEADGKPGAAAADDLLDALTDGQLATVEELARQCLERGATLADVRGYTGDEIEAVYRFAHDVYRQRRYHDARKLFHFLAENDHTESRFWMGLGASLQMTACYREALSAYGVAAVLDATNPEPPLRAAECYLATDAPDGARKALDAVRLACEAGGAGPAEADVLRRAALLGTAVDRAGAVSGVLSTREAARCP